MRAMKGIGVGAATKIENTRCAKFEQENFEIILLCDHAHDDFEIPSNR